MMTVVGSGLIRHGATVGLIGHGAIVSKHGLDAVNGRGGVDLKNGDSVKGRWNVRPTCDADILRKRVPADFRGLLSGQEFVRPQVSHVDVGLGGPNGRQCQPAAFWI